MDVSNRLEQDVDAVILASKELKSNETQQVKVGLMRIGELRELLPARLCQPVRVIIRGLVREVEGRTYPRELEIEVSEGHQGLDCTLDRPSVHALVNALQPRQGRNSGRTVACYDRREQFVQAIPIGGFKRYAQRVECHRFCFDECVADDSSELAVGWNHPLASPAVAEEGTKHRSRVFLVSNEATGLRNQRLAFGLSDPPPVQASSDLLAMQPRNSVVVVR